MNYYSQYISTIITKTERPFTQRFISSTKEIYDDGEKRKAKKRTLLSALSQNNKLQD